MDETGDLQGQAQALSRWLLNSMVVLALTVQPPPLRTGPLRTRSWQTPRSKA